MGSNFKGKNIFIRALFFSLLFYPFGRAETVDKSFLTTLPPEEQAMKDEVDHWGLPFSDQLRRFISARSSFRNELGNRAPKNFILGIQHGLEKVAQNKYWFKGDYTSTVELEAARNEYECFQIAVLPDIGKSLSNVSVSPQDLRSRDSKEVIPSRMIEIYRVGYVKTVPARYPSLYTGPWPDYFLPNAPLEISGTDLGLFWVEIKVPEETSPGDYRGELTVRADSETVSVQLNLHVYDFTLPDRVPFPIAVWTNPRWPGGEEMTAEEYRPLVAEFLKHGVDPVSVGKQFFSLQENDFRVLDENLHFSFDRGLQLFEIPRAAPEQLKPLVEHLRRKGWIEKALIYSNQDEPDAELFRTENIPFYREMHSFYPELRIYLASEYHPQIDDGCDIWMTDLSTGEGVDFARNNSGKAELWFYYCHLPVRIDYIRPLIQAPNMMIDNEAVEHRLTLWLAWKYEIRGMFIWAGNWDWGGGDADRRDWENKGWHLPDKPSGFPYAGIHNGNGYLIYPGPCPSIRLKVIRDGLEDYGYFMELRKRAEHSASEKLRREAKKLLSIPEKVLIDSHYFNRNPRALIETRKEIARLIEALGE